MATRKMVPLFFVGRARNVLVGVDILDVKLGDLGAARNVKREVDYAYVATSTATTHAPARWMPLEARATHAAAHA